MSDTVGDVRRGSGGDLRDRARRRGVVSVLTGDDAGRYPHGNSVLVEGTDLTVLIDPSLSLRGRGEELGHVDVVLLTHVHEDHVAGLGEYPDAEVHVHWADQQALRSVDDLLAVYGLPEARHADMRSVLVDDFAFSPRPDALPFGEGATLELGGGTSITAVHLPGHTPGHCAFLVEPEGVVVLGDIELSGFGPYYADATSSLADFEASLERAADLDADWYVTFHHKGVIDDRATYARLLADFAAVIDRRDAALVEYLARPRTVADMVRHRFLYRPHVELVWADAAEEHTIRAHLARLVGEGRVVETGRDTYRAV